MRHDAHPKCPFLGAALGVSVCVQMHGCREEGRGGEGGEGRRVRDALTFLSSSVGFQLAPLSSLNSTLRWVGAASGVSGWG